MRFSIENRQGEVLYNLSNQEGITVGDLYRIIKTMIDEDTRSLDMPVSVCLQGCEPFSTRVVTVTNEGDFSTMWLEMAEDHPLAKFLGDDYE